jgi:hypothetical protein
MSEKQPSQHIPPTRSYVTFNSNMDKLAYFLVATEEMYDKQAKILRWRARAARNELPKLERQMDEFLKKSGLSKADEKRFNKIGSRVEYLTDIDIFAPATLEQFRQFPEFFRILALSHLVTIFRGYLTDIVQEIFLAHPDALKSSKQLTSEEVLAQGGWKQIISYLAEREAEEVENSSFPKVVEYFGDKFNINLNASVVSPEQITEILATRNIHIHNKGIVNRHFLKLVKDSTFRLGAYKRITKTYFDNAASCVETIVRFIDFEVRAKYLVNQ